MRDKGTGMWLCELLPFFDMTKEEMIEHWAEIVEHSGYEFEE